jgi:hypothetical protein
MASIYRHSWVISLGVMPELIAKARIPPADEPMTLLMGIPLCNSLRAL